MVISQYILAFLLLAVAAYSLRAGLVVLVLLLPVANSTLVPREMFGITGVNTLNILVLIIFLKSVLRFTYQPIDLSAFEKVPKMLWAYIFIMSLAAFIGIQNAHYIPQALVEKLDIGNIDTPITYAVTYYIKPMVIVLAGLAIAAAVNRLGLHRELIYSPGIAAAILALCVLVFVAISGQGLGVLADANSRGFLSWTGMHANEIGLTLNVGLPFALFAASDAKKFSQIFFIGISAIVGIAVLLTFSRGAYLGLVAIVAFYFFGKQRTLVGKVLLVLAAMVGLFLLPGAVWERAATGFSNGDTDAITAGRAAHIWAPLITEIQNAPLAIRGLSAMLWSEGMRSGESALTGHSHSAYIGAAFDLGVVGAVFLLAFWAMCCRWFFQAGRYYQQKSDWLTAGFFRAAGVSVVCILVQGVTDDRLWPTFPQSAIWVAVGVLIGLLSKEQILEAPVKAMRVRPAPRRRVERSPSSGDVSATGVAERS